MQICKKCGSTQFKLVADLLISDVTADGKDLLANRTINKERVITLNCAKCGNRIIDSFLKKPIPLNDWEEHWDSYITDFIHSTEQFIVNRELEDEDDKEEAFLRGMAKGMWSVHAMIESLLVQDKMVTGRKTTYHLKRLGEMMVAEDHSLAS